MEQVVNFSFAAAIAPEQQKKILETIRRWPKVRAASHLRPGAKNVLVRRMAFARLSDDADVSAIRHQIESLPAIEQASIPAARRLLGSAHS